MNEIEFLKQFIANSRNLMWFLGSGASRSAGLPTATDIIWDLKLKCYCLEENQNFSTHDINNEAVKSKIQSYLESNGFPSLGSPNEYSYYFDRYFGDDYSAQRQYISKILSSDKVSLNIGHRALAALLSLNKTRVVFTTNFDEVLEIAFAFITGNPLSSFNLEGSYAALDALNDDQFPLYAKIHGDFKYRNIKNLSPDLESNDIKIQDCFLKAAVRFGMVVSGYSGRDNNVMEMFHTAIKQNDSFPFGIYWTVPSLESVDQKVVSFIEEAKKHGVSAHLVESGTFDSMLSKIWRQTEEKPTELDNKVRTIKKHAAVVPLPSKGVGFPLIRTNALRIISLPDSCAKINLASEIDHEELKELIKSKKSDAIIKKSSAIFAWGKRIEIEKVFESKSLIKLEAYSVDDVINWIENDNFIRSLYERALVLSCLDSTVVSLKNDKGFYISIKDFSSTDEKLLPLKNALKTRDGRLGQIGGVISNKPFITWSEAISVKLEIRNGEAYMMLKPTIWIEPSSERRNQIEFIRIRRLHRYNKVSNDLIDAWINILLGNKERGKDVVLTLYENSEFPAQFTINSRTAYSKKKS